MGATNKLGHKCRDCGIAYPNVEHTCPRYATPRWWMCNGCEKQHQAPRDLDSIGCCGVGFTVVPRRIQPPESPRSKRTMHSLLGPPGVTEHAGVITVQPGATLHLPGGVLPSREDATNPTHYRQFSLETIDRIKEVLGPEGFVAFCRGNVVKYTERAGRKGDCAEDMKKASWYASMAAGVDPRGSRE